MVRIYRYLGKVFQAHYLQNEMSTAMQVCSTVLRRDSTDQEATSALQAEFKVEG